MLPKWLMKSEPDEFSILDFAARGGEEWGGVRNYQARNFLREMRVGERFFFYHSSCAEPGVVGIGEIARAAAPDPSQFDLSSDYFDPKSTTDQPRWDSVWVRFVTRLYPRAGELADPLQPALTLAQLRAAGPALQGLRLLDRGSRLSVIPVAPEHARWLLEQTRAA
jgi:predicted RNA-binding protein with PUA-like domain